MTIKFFLIYAGTLLASSIVLLTLVKHFAGSFADSGKKPVIYGGLSSILASLAVYFTQLIYDNLFTIFIILASIFFSFGIIHYRMTHNNYFSPTNGSRAKIFLGETVFSMSVVLFTIFIFSSLQYFLKEDKSFLFYPMMMSGLVFFIPGFFMYTFEAAYIIPPPEYNTWVYPEQPLDLADDDPREKLLVIGFEIGKKIRDIKKAYFRAKAPESIYLGDLYYFFINDYNELQSETQIEFYNDKEPCEWVFRLKRKWYQSEYVLDPGKTVKDNGIKENSVIICERV